MTNEEFQTLVLQRLDQLDMRIHIGLDGVETRLRGLETLHRHHMQQVNKLFNSRVDRLEP